MELIMIKATLTMQPSCLKAKYVLHVFITSTFRRQWFGFEHGFEYSSDAHGSAKWTYMVVVRMPGQ